MGITSSLLKVGALVAVVAVGLAFINSRRDDISAGIDKTRQGITDRLGFFSGGGSSGGLDELDFTFTKPNGKAEMLFPLQTEKDLRLLAESQSGRTQIVTTKGFTSFESERARFESFNKLSAIDPTLLAGLSPEDRKRQRLVRELSIAPEVKFSTSLAGSPFAIGPQIKRDTDFAFTKFDVTLVNEGSSQFQKVLARETARSESIFSSLFGNVQNPNFDLGLPSDATQADRDFVIARQAELNARRNFSEALAQDRLARGIILGETIGTTGLQQKENLKLLGINLGGGTTLSPESLARLQEAGLFN